MSQSFLNSGTLVILCTRVLWLCAVVCKRGGEVSLTRVQIQADAVLCYRFWRQSVMMSSSPSQGQKRRWYSGEHSCLQSSFPGFDSRPTQFCVTGSEDRVISWVRVPFGVWSVVVSIASLKASTPGSIPSLCSVVLQVLKTESYHESRSCY